MRIWIDAQLSPALANWISENFASIEAIAVHDLGLRDAEDQVIFFSARQANATVMPRTAIFSNCKNNSEHRRKLSGLLAEIFKKLG